MLMKTRILFLLTFVAICCTAMAQLQVKGTVVSAKDSEPMIGVAVVEQGTTNGVITDLDGNYAIQVKNGNASLVVSYVGYKTQTVKVNGRNVINIRLEEDTKVLDEVVVVGYGVQKKSDVTGAVASVKSDDLKFRSTSDAAAALQGKAAGVQILNTSGKPGQGASIRVRGYSSNSDKIGPLLIVDGLQVSSIQYLDPDLIESMEVLKDAASASIYGAEAGNGVVLITTKNGKNNSKGTITYQAKMTMNSLGNTPELLNAPQFTDWMKMNLGEERVVNDMNTYKEQFGWDPNTNTDWMDVYFGNSWTQQHSLSFQGGNDRGNFFLNVNYIDQDGIVKGHKDYYERLTTQLNADYKIFDWLQVGTNNSIEKWRSGGVSEQAYGSSFEMLLLIDPLTPVYWSNENQMLPEYRSKLEAVKNGTSALPYSFYGDENGYYATSYFNQRLAGGSPLSQRDRAYGKNSGINVNGTAFANITPFKWLTITSRLGYRLFFNNTSDYSTPYYLNSQTSGTTYSISGASNNGTYYQWENFATFNETFDVHAITAMAGMSYRQTDNNGVNARATGPDILKAYSPNFIYLDCVNSNTDTSKSFGGMPSKTSSLSYFGRLVYTFDNRYSLQFNMRADAFDSSKLSEKNRWGYFPSLSAGWTLSNEKFFSENISKDLISFARFRASWGRNGNVNVLNNYAYTASIATNGQWYQYGTTNAASYGSMPSGLANPDLTWETFEQVDLGLDMRLFNDRLTLGMDYYSKITKDLLVTAPCLPESGVSSMTINAGKVKNTGFELEASWKDKIGDLTYGISGNVAFLSNKVTYLDPSISRLTGAEISGSNLLVRTYFEQGMPVWYMRCYKYKGVAEDGSALFYTKDGGETLDPTEEDMCNIGSGIPTYTYGLTVNAQYKGFDLNIFGAGAGGNDVFYGLYRTGYNNISKHFYDKAKSNEMPDPSKVAGNLKYWSSSACVFDGSYFKIKQIQLGYTLPKSISQMAYIQNLRLYVSLDDFFTFTSYPGLDPETCSVGTNGLGFDTGAYPNMKKLVFGVSVTF